MKRAALHPIYMAAQGLHPQITLLRVHRWPVMKKRLMASTIPCYALFGRFDLLMNTYGSQAEDMDVFKNVFLSAQGIEETLYTELTVAFCADIVDRLHGQAIAWPSEAVEMRVSEDDIHAVVKLQHSWDAMDEDVRNRLIEREIILPEPIDALDGDGIIRAFVLIRLPVVSSSEFDMQRKFLNGTVFRDYSDKIPTVMWSAAQMGNHLYLECEVKTIRELVIIVMDKLHELDPRGFESDTYIAVEKLNSVDPTIEEELGKLPQDTGDTTLQRFQEISNIINKLVSKYYPDEAAKLKDVNVVDRVSAVDAFNQMATLLDSILDLSDDSDLTRASMEARNDIIMTALFSDTHYIKKVGQQMGGTLETKIRRVVANRAKERFETAKEMQETLKLKSAKPKYLFEEMTGGQVYSTIKTWEKTFPGEPLFPAEFVEQWHDWSEFRDRAVHGRPLQAKEAVSNAIDGLRIIDTLVKLRAGNRDQVKFDSPKEGG